MVNHRPPWLIWMMFPAPRGLLYDCVTVPAAGATTTVFSVAFVGTRKMSTAGACPNDSSRTWVPQANGSWNAGRDAFPATPPPVAAWAAPAPTSAGMNDAIRPTIASRSQRRDRRVPPRPNRRDRGSAACGGAAAASSAAPSDTFSVGCMVLPLSDLAGMGETHSRKTQWMVRARCRAGGSASVFGPASAPMISADRLVRVPPERWVAHREKIRYGRAAADVAWRDHDSSGRWPVVVLARIMATGGATARGFRKARERFVSQPERTSGGNCAGRSTARGRSAAGDPAAARGPAALRTRR
ncbi:hypothetical protein FRACA_50071 [Frankia canadensis]|uniref:Uncharacterized protein n=1 Tax=Frankia canadensis TaxID=1836972 RepID=A0A2I2KYE1_9ACTN|nr:hypothetical protein FRACA_50071 [Frankia canadensis]SOU57973.1 hypothetical protein FRACA_50071 [Frankia canadensis]